MPPLRMAVRTKIHHMATKISDLNIAREDLLPAPRELHLDLPVSEAEAAHIVRARAHGADDTARRG